MQPVVVVTRSDLAVLEAGASACAFAPPRQLAAHLAPKLRDLAKRLAPLVVEEDRDGVAA